MLLNEDPCKGCVKEIIQSGCVEDSGFMCVRDIEYQAQRELLGKVVEDLRKMAKVYLNSVAVDKNYNNYAANALLAVAKGYEQQPKEANET